MKWLLLSSIFLLPRLGVSQYFGELYSGVAWSKMSLPDEIETKINPTMNPTFGVAIIRTLEPKFAIKLSARFISHGFVGEETDRSDLIKYRLQYLLVSPSFEYRFARKFESRFGLSFNRLLSTRRSSGNSDWENVEEYHFFKKSEIGLIGEIGYQIHKFYLCASYSHGVTNIAAENWTDLNGEEIQDPTAYNRAIKLALSYRFKL